MMGEIFGIAIVALLALGGALVLWRLRAVRNRQAAEKFAAAVTDAQIRRNLRNNVPVPRPYGVGDFGTDVSGKKKYVADANGSLRRVELVKTNMGTIPLPVKKITKVERRKRRAAARLDDHRMAKRRMDVAAEIDLTLAKIRAGLIERGADPVKVAEINPLQNDWHSLGHAICESAKSATASRKHDNVYKLRRLTWPSR